MPEKLTVQREAMERASGLSVAGSSPPGASAAPREAAPAARVGALDKKGNNVSMGDQERHAEAQRRRRYYREGAQRLLQNVKFEGKGKNKGKAVEHAIGRCGQYAGYGAMIGDERAVIISRGKYGAFVKYTTSCKSVWACPVCQAKILKIRCDQVREQVERHQSEGGTVFMVTLTESHKHGHDVRNTVKAQKARLRKLRAGASYGRIARDECGVIGGCNSGETTLGLNGFHPHIHSLYFFKPGTTAAQVSRFWGWLSNRWIELCEADGVKASREFQVLTMASTEGGAAEYVTKGGVAFEMTHSHTKSSSMMGRTPAQLLKAYCDEQDTEAGEAYVEFAKAYHGVAQLSWFGEIRSRVNNADETDAEALEKAEDQAEEICAIDATTFRAVQRAGVYDLLMTAVTHSGFDGARAVFANHRLGNIWPATKATRLKPEKIQPSQFWWSEKL
jgi:hypothetical protein